jgi:hypothetical protein
VAVVQVGGGLVVCANAWALLRAEDTTPNLPVRTPSAVEIATRAFYPLTLPLTVGPGTISVAITIGAHHPQSVRSLLVNAVADTVGAVLIAATVFVCYRYADRTLRMLGETGTSVLRSTVRVHRALHRRADRVDRRFRPPRDATDKCCALRVHAVAAALRISYNFLAWSRRRGNVTATALRNLWPV